MLVKSKRRKRRQTKVAARKPKEKNYIFAIGRRKTSTARVRLFKGKDQTLVNDLPFAQYFAGPTASKLLVKPFQVTETEGKYFVTAKTVGGGKNGQLEAVIHGIPALTLGLNAATPVSINKIKNIEYPIYPDRQLWLNNLAYGQFHVEEFQNGVVWEHINNIIEQQGK